MDASGEDLLDTLQAKGWSILRRDARRPVDFGQAGARRPLPARYLEFVAAFSRCVNREGTAWFLAEEDYLGRSDGAFAWDEWEKMSRDAAQRHPAILEQVDRFWRGHLPIALSVKDGYSYLALALSGDAAGLVVSGREPEFEEVEVVAPSFGSFLDDFARAAKGSASKSSLQDFL